MAKNKAAKKFDTPETTQESQVTQEAQVEQEAQAEQTTNGEDTTPTTQFTPKPMFYLIGSDEKQYQFTRFNMPKKAEKNPEGEIRVIIEGVEHPAWMTSSKGWAADDARIDYVWLSLVGGANGYITLDYGVDAVTFDGAEFTLGEGKANRENPKRVPRDPVKEENRKQQFTQTMAKRAEKPAEGAENPEGQTQPAAEGEQPQQAA
jgi:hypothetical protein